MSDPNIIDVTPDELTDFKKWRALNEADKQSNKEEKKVDKKEAPKWRCSDCGETLGDGAWTSRQLSRAHPDGCPRCGSTVATVE